MRIAPLLAILTLTASGGCSTLYVNDANLAKQADAADAAVQAADTINPYTVQLANLQALGAQEDQAVAALGVARRDAFVAKHLGDPPAALAQALKGDACARLADLSGGTPCAADGASVKLFNALAALSHRIAVAQAVVDDDQATAASIRADYERDKTSDDTDKDSCVAILNPPAGPPPKVSAAAAGHYNRLIRLCQSLDTAQKALAAIGSAPNFGAGSPLGKALAESAPPAPNPASVGPNDEVLKAQIKAAAALSKDGNAATLATFQAEVERLLRDASTAAKIAGLKTLQAGISDQLNGDLCTQTPPVNGTDCKAIAATSASGRAVAVWTALQALAQVLDANDPRYRSASWLAAANAILAAEKQDAQIQADAEAQAASLARTRLFRLAAAASHLAEAHGFAAKTKPCSGADPAYCGLAATLAAWNEGLIPADVLAYRETQVFSQTVVRRQRAAQTEQQALARSASASLKAYADGGVPPSVIAQLLVDAGLIAAVAAK
jgi:hypothetical protein